MKNVLMAKYGVPVRVTDEEAYRIVRRQGGEFTSKSTYRAVWTNMKKSSELEAYEKEQRQKALEHGTRSKKRKSKDW